MDVIEDVATTSLDLEAEFVDFEDHRRPFLGGLGPALIDSRAILAAILEEYALPVHGQHGVVHWARVLENGLRISEVNGADRDVVTLFALFHDSRRVSEGDDEDHGLRGGEFARSLRGRLIHLDDDRFDLLFEACRRHTDGLTTGDRTLLACWDADRLDLGRVGIRPDPRRLCTDAGRDLLAWAQERAMKQYEPREILASWGVEPSGNPDGSRGNRRRWSPRLP